MKKSHNKETYKKEDVNRKTSIIFMQLGLVLALLLAYIAIESKTLVHVKFDEGQIAQNDFDDEFIPDTTPEPPKEEKKQKQTEPEPILDDPEIIDNSSEEKESFIDTGLLDPETETKIIKLEDIPEVIIKEEVIEIPISVAEKMPVFPGCKGNSKELKMCLSKEIGKIVKRYFNPDIAQDIGLKPGKNRIFVMFVIDKQGNISKIKSNAPHKSLEKEAIRVLGKIPQIKPGKFQGRNVGVKYSLPITYQVIE